MHDEAWKWLDHRLTMFVTLVSIAGMIGGWFTYSATIRAELTNQEKEIVYLRTRYNAEIYPREQIVERLGSIDKKMDHLTDLLIQHERLAERREGN